LVYAFIRGESSEHVITGLANIGVSQVKVETDGIIARPDIMGKGPNIAPSDFLVVKQKDNASLGKAP
jgi:hypothetical protein